MVNVFLDTDVTFDIIGKREPYSKISIEFVKLSSIRKLVLNISEVSMANLCYLSFETYKLPSANKNLSDFIKYCNILPSGKKIFLQALESDFKDKEDGIQYFTALDHEMDYFITRNVKDYSNFTSRLLVLSP